VTIREKVVKEEYVDKKKKDKRKFIESCDQLKRKRKRDHKIGTMLKQTEIKQHREMERKRYSEGTVIDRQIEQDSERH